MTAERVCEGNPLAAATVIQTLSFCKIPQLFILRNFHPALTDIFL